MLRILPPSHALILGATLLGISGCATAPAPAPQERILCKAIAGAPSESITLAFGLSLPGGGEITEADWEDFLAREVTPDFPAGLSVTEVRGQWQDTPASPIIHERARLVWIIAPSGPGLGAKLTAIRNAYKKRFNQSSVAAFIHSGCASF